jgi:hypothetical protein
MSGTVRFANERLETQATDYELMVKARPGTDGHMRGD